MTRIALATALNQQKEVQTDLGRILLVCGSSIKSYLHGWNQPVKNNRRNQINQLISFQTALIGVEQF